MVAGARRYDPPRSSRRVTQQTGEVLWDRGPASTPATTTWTCGRSRPRCGSPGCRRPTPNGGRGSSSATATWSGCARTACWAAAGTRGDSALLKSLNAIGRAGIDDDGYRAGTPELRLQDMDRDGLAAVGDLRTAGGRAADRRPGVAGPLLRGVERLGDRGVQRGRSRSVVRARRSCPATRPRQRRRSWSAAPGWVTEVRSSTSSKSNSVIPRGTGCGPPPSTLVSRSASTSRVGCRRD